MNTLARPATRPLEERTDLYEVLSLAAGIKCEALRPAPAPSDPIAAWAASGLAMLTGSADRPVFPRRDIAGRLDTLLRTVQALATRCGAPLDLDMGVFSERAADLGLRRCGDMSCNGTARLLRARDGWLAVNLARPDDFDAVPAWIGAATTKPWAALAEAAHRATAAEMAARGQLLGIPAAAVSAPSETPAEGPRLVRMATPPAPTPRTLAGLTVVDLSSLWAGPLCGHLFARLGARVIKVESTTRPDGARSAAPTFFDRLNAAKESVALDFASPSGRQILAHLIAGADIVIESSRPRALDQLGIDRAACFRSNSRLVWIAITAYGRSGDLAMRVGFGDDAGASAGLLAGDADRPCFVGDALADPATGLMAMAGALAAFVGGGGYLVDATLAGSAGWLAGAPAAPIRSGESWQIHATGRTHVLAPPVLRPPGPAAPALGRDTAAVLRGLAS